MANKSRFFIAEASIKTFFKQGNKKTYSIVQLNEILEQNRNLWNLPVSLTINKFADKLLNSEILSKQEIVFEGNLISNKERFSVEDVSIFQLAVSLVNKSYLSHYSAVFLHGLTTQIPKTIYISVEQSKKNIVRSELKQEAIDIAFSKPQRKSNTTSLHDGYTFLVHNGMYANRSGVYTLDDLPITNIERTLIDIAVRPNYAGGVFSVLDVYRNAIDKISINKLVAILDKLNFIYPYHQTIGFYLEKVGYDSKKLEILRQRPILNDFYLTYQILDKEYDNSWKLYYPKGM